MTSVKTDKIKVGTYITKEADEKLEALVKATGMTKSKLAALAIQSGIDAIGLAFNPDWREYFETQLALGKKKNASTN